MLKTLLKNFWRQLNQKKIEPQITDAVTQVVNLDKMGKVDLLIHAKRLNLKVNPRMRKEQIKAIVEKAGE